MITENTYELEERKIAKIFQLAGWSQEPEINYARIDSIEQRALHEQATKESIDFIFHSFGEVMHHFSGSFFGSIATDDHDYKA